MGGCWIINQYFARPKNPTVGGDRQNLYEWASHSYTMAVERWQEAWNKNRPPLPPSKHTQIPTSVPRTEVCCIDGRDYARKVGKTLFHPVESKQTVSYPMRSTMCLRNKDPLPGTTFASTSPIIADNHYFSFLSDCLLNFIGDSSQAPTLVTITRYCFFCVYYIRLRCVLSQSMRCLLD